MDEEGGENDPQALLATLTELANITDYEEALDQIEAVGDTIDNICDIVSASQELAASEEGADGAEQQISKIFLDNDIVGLFLKLLRSPCEEVIKLTLNGLDRLIASSEISVRVVKGGGFSIITEVFTQSKTSDDVYLKTKASDVITYLIAPTEHKRLKAEILENDVFTEHVAMLLTELDECVERAAQFLWCLTDNYEEAQVKVAAEKQVVEKLLRTIAESDIGRNSLRVLLNIVRSEQAREHLPRDQISLLMRSILKIPDEHMSEKDKSIAAVIFGYLYEPEHDVDPNLVIRFADLLYDSLYGLGRSGQSLQDLLQGIANFATNQKALLHIAESPITKSLLSVFALEEDVGKSKGIFDLSFVKTLASKIILGFSHDNDILRQREGLIDEDTAEIFHILIDGADQDLSDNITKILKNVHRFNNDEKSRRESENQAKLAEEKAKLAEEQAKLEAERTKPEGNTAKTENLPKLDKEDYPEENLELTDEELASLAEEAVPVQKFEDLLVAAPVATYDDASEHKTQDEGIHLHAEGPVPVHIKETAPQPDLVESEKIEIQVTQIDTDSSKDTIYVEKTELKDNQLVHSEIVQAEIDNSAKVVTIVETDVDVVGDVAVITTKYDVIDASGESPALPADVAVSKVDVELSASFASSVDVDDAQLHVSFDVPAVSFDAEKLVDGIVAGALETLCTRVDEKLRNIATTEVEVGIAAAVPARNGIEEADDVISRKHEQVEAATSFVGDNHRAEAKRVIVWNFEDVGVWLTEIGLLHLAHSFGSNRVNGAALLEMARRVDDVKFVKLVAEKLKVDFFGDLLVICHELRKLETL